MFGALRGACVPVAGEWGGDGAVLDGRLSGGGKKSRTEKVVLSIG